MAQGKVHSIVTSSSQSTDWSLPAVGQILHLHSTPTLQRQSERESEVRSYPRRLPLAITRALGCRVKDEQGQVYLDCLAGAGALPLGHNHPEVNAAIIEALEGLSPFQTLDITSPAKDAFMGELLATLPEAFGSEAKIQFCGPSGADAVEAAIKLAKTVTGRSSVISFQGGYHGMTHGALSLTGNLGAKNSINGLMADVHFMPYPYPFRSQFGDRDSDNARQALHYLRSQLVDPEGGIKRPAAIIVEPIQGEGGVIPAPAEWLQGLRKLCDELEILLIMDEIQTGFGRSGRLFAFEHAEIQPDIVLMSKALGGGLPLSVIAFNKRFDAWSPGGHAGTFRGNQLAMVSGAKTMQVIKRDKLYEHANELGGQLRDELLALQQKHTRIGQVRAKGFMLGLELVCGEGTLDSLGNPLADSVYARRVQREALRRGLICELGGRHGAVVRLLPPLILDREEADFIIRVLDEALTVAAHHSDNEDSVVNG
jgi:2,4-diaminobutyrate 4-transaminase